MVTLQDTLKDCRTFLPEPFRASHERLFGEEHLTKLANRLGDFWHNGAPAEFPLPHFSVECTPPLQEAWAFFEEPLRLWHADEGKRLAPELLQKFAVAFATATCKNILILLGQRITPASLTDARAIPPTKAQLLASAAREYSQGLTAAGRALAKHWHRSSDKFWGEVRGSAADKNAAALRIISYILENTTWWNIFGHFKHDTVYEARVTSGQGVRWGKGGEELIGFLEPFDE